MDVRTLVDAGPLIGWLNSGDQWHAWSVTTLVSRAGTLHTTEVILGEACHQLGGNTAPVQALLSLVREGGVVLHPIWPTHLMRTQELMAKFERMDAGDASLVVLSELNPKAMIVTVDRRDFGMYRRFRDQPLPLIMP